MSYLLSIAFSMTSVWRIKVNFDWTDELRACLNRAVCQNNSKLRNMNDDFEFALSLKLLKNFLVILMQQQQQQKRT